MVVFYLFLLSFIAFSDFRLESEPSQGPPKASTVENPSSFQKILSAKKVFLTIADPSTEGTSGLFSSPSENRQPASGELAKAIRKWNRFTIVHDVSEADLVLVIVEWEDFHSWGKTVACRDWLLVFDGGSLPTTKSRPLWQGDREQWGKWGGCSGGGEPGKQPTKEIEGAEKAAGHP